MTLPPILIAGPTASGKSALALRLAADGAGVIVNADSMQVYRDLHILSARPSPSEMTRAPHRLFGHVDASERYSVGRWLVDIGAVLAELQARGMRPIIVGGTGLYFRVLTEGLAPVPTIPADIREGWLERAASMTTEALHELLAARAPSEAARLRPSDRTRVLRALEVFDATGRTLADWQAGRHARPLIDPAEAHAVALLPDRAELHHRIDGRFRVMVDGGGLEEAQRLTARGLNPDLPAMKAIGVRPLLAYLRAQIDRETAIAQGQAETRQYAKRQMTWVRNQMAGWQVVTPDWEPPAHPAR